MVRTLRSKRSLLIGFAAVAMAVMTQEAPSAQGQGDDEIMQAFGHLQKAIKAKDAAGIWALLDGDTQADADKVARKVKGVYKKATEKEKADHETNLGLTADEFTKLDGKLLLKSKRFLGKYDEIPDSKITGITVQGDAATLNYLEADGDKEKLAYTRQDGKWNVALPMPKFTK